MEWGKRAKTNFQDKDEGETPSSFSTAGSYVYLYLGQSQCQGPAEAQVETETESGQGSKVNQVSMNDLPPEILTEILKNVDPRSLFECRLVNSQWNEISSRILRTSSDYKMTFHFDNAKLYQPRFRQSTKRQGTTLNKFLICMKRAKSCPFGNFSFVCEDRGSYNRSWNFNPSRFFGYKDWTKFLSAIDESNENQNRNERIKIKSLEFIFNGSNESFKEFIENLRHLLNKIPHLEELGLKFPEVWSEKYEERLFPRTTENSAVQLVHLKTINFDPSMILKCPGTLKDLFNAAVNLRKIHLYKSTPNLSSEICNFLHSVGKLELLKAFFFDVNDPFFSQRPDFTRNMLNFKLEELEFGKKSRPNNSSQLDPTDFISSLFKSTKDSLKKLVMIPLGNLNRLQFPKFKNLTELKLKIVADPQNTFFPQGVGYLDIFPAVRELELPERDWMAAFPHFDYIPIFPRVENLSLVDLELTADCIPVLALLCPNLKHLKIQKVQYSNSKINLLEVGRQIWTLMNTLESLEIDVDVALPENNPIALDSCFTGISLENCQRLHDLKEADTLLKKWGSSTRISESELRAKITHPSILNMTNLKTLKINAYAGNWFRRLKSEEFFSEKLTWVSEEFAFKFLPHLKPKPKE